MSCKRTDCFAFLFVNLILYEWINVHCLYLLYLLYVVCLYLLYLLYVVCLDLLYFLCCLSIFSTFSMLSVSIFFMFSKFSISLPMSIPVLSMFTISRFSLHSLSIFSTLPCHTAAHWQLIKAPDSFSEASRSCGVVTGKIPEDVTSLPV